MESMRAISTPSPLAIDRWPSPSDLHAAKRSLAFGLISLETTTETKGLESPCYRLGRDVPKQPLWVAENGTGSPVVSLFSSFEDKKSGECNRPGNKTYARCIGRNVVKLKVDRVAIEVILSALAFCNLDRIDIVVVVRKWNDGGDALSLAKPDSTNILRLRRLGIRGRTLSAQATSLACNVCRINQGTSPTAADNNRFGWSANEKGKVSVKQGEPSLGKLSKEDVREVNTLNKNLPIDL